MKPRIYKTRGRQRGTLRRVLLPEKDPVALEALS
jgi:hypothetical protein